MRRVEESIVRRLGKALEIHFEVVAEEPLPRRWVDLIHHLNEQEAKPTSNGERKSNGTKA